MQRTVQQSSKEFSGDPPQHGAVHCDQASSDRHQCLAQKYNRTTPHQDLNMRPIVPETPVEKLRIREPDKEG